MTIMKGKIIKILSIITIEVFLAYQISWGLIVSPGIDDNLTSFAIPQGNSEITFHDGPVFYTSTDSSPDLLVGFVGSSVGNYLTTYDIQLPALVEDKYSDISEQIITNIIKGETLNEGNVTLLYTPKVSLTIKDNQIISLIELTTLPQEFPILTIERTYIDQIHKVNGLDEYGSILKETDLTTGEIKLFTPDGAPLITRDLIRKFIQDKREQVMQYAEDMQDGVGVLDGGFVPQVDLSFTVSPGEALRIFNESPYGQKLQVVEELLGEPSSEDGDLIEAAEKLFLAELENKKDYYISALKDIDKSLIENKMVTQISLGEGGTLPSKDEDEMREEIESRLAMGSELPYIPNYVLGDLDTTKFHIQDFIGERGDFKGEYSSTDVIEFLKEIRDNMKSTLGWFTLSGETIPGGDEESISNLERIPDISLREKIESKLEEYWHLITGVIGAGGFLGLEDFISEAEIYDAQTGSELREWLIEVRGFDVEKYEDAITELRGYVEEIRSWNYLPKDVEDFSEEDLAFDLYVADSKEEFNEIFAKIDQLNYDSVASIYKDMNDCLLRKDALSIRDINESIQDMNGRLSEEGKDTLPVYFDAEKKAVDKLKERVSTVTELADLAEEFIGAGYYQIATKLMGEMSILSEELVREKAALAQIVNFQDFLEGQKELIELTPLAKVVDWIMLGDMNQLLNEDIPRLQSALREQITSNIIGERSLNALGEVVLNPFTDDNLAAQVSGLLDDISVRRGTISAIEFGLQSAIQFALLSAVSGGVGTLIRSSAFFTKLGSWFNSARSTSRLVNLIWNVGGYTIRPLIKGLNYIDEYIQEGFLALAGKPGALIGNALFRGSRVAAGAVRMGINTGIVGTSAGLSAAFPEASLIGKVARTVRNPLWVLPASNALLEPFGIPLPDIAEFTHLVVYGPGGHVRNLTPVPSGDSRFSNIGKEFVTVVQELKKVISNEESLLPSDTVNRILERLPAPGLTVQPVAGGDNPLIDTLNNSEASTDERIGALSGIRELVESGQSINESEAEAIGQGAGDLLYQLGGMSQEQVDSLFSEFDKYIHAIDSGKKAYSLLPFTYALHKNIHHLPLQIDINGEGYTINGVFVKWNLVKDIYKGTVFEKVEMRDITQPGGVEQLTTEQRRLYDDIQAARNNSGGLTGLKTALSDAGDFSGSSIELAALVLEGLKEAGIFNGGDFWPNQVVAVGTAIDENSMLNVPSGQGKSEISLALALAKIIRTGKRSHIWTIDGSLVGEFNKRLISVFEQLGIEVKTLTAQELSDLKALEPDKYNEEVEGYKQADILVLEWTAYGFGALQDGLGRYQKELFTDQKENLSVLIDEADFILVDEATTPLKIVYTQREVDDRLNSTLTDHKAMLEEYDFGELGVGFEKDVDFKVVERHEVVDGRTRHIKKIEFTSRGSEKLHILNRRYDEYEGDVIVEHIRNLLYAEYIFVEERDYFVYESPDGERKIVLIGAHGFATPERTLEVYQPYIEAKHNIPVTREAKGGMFTTVPFLINDEELSDVTIMSATIKPVVDIIRSVYKRFSDKNVNRIRRNEFNRVDTPFRIFTEAGSKLSFAARQVKELSDAGKRVVLGGVKKLDRLDEMERYLIEAEVDPAKIIKLGAENLYGEAEDIGQLSENVLNDYIQNMQDGQILLVGREMGRGKDIKLSSEENYVVAIATESITDEPRFILQFLPRAGRGNNTGFGIALASLEDSIFEQFQEKKADIEAEIEQIKQKLTELGIDIDIDNEGLLLNPDLYPIQVQGHIENIINIVKGISQTGFDGMASEIEEQANIVTGNLEVMHESVDLIKDAPVDSVDSYIKFLEDNEFFTEEIRDALEQTGRRFRFRNVDELRKAVEDKVDSFRGHLPNIHGAIVKDIEEDLWDLVTEESHVNIQDTIRLRARFALIYLILYQI